MARFFKNFDIIDYRFGDNEPPVLFNNITQYVDMVDKLKDNVSFYNKYTIVAGERPDTLAYELYGNTDYYWTFYLMNDHIRESGWPIPDHELLEYAKKRFPHRVTTTQSNFAVNFPVGQVVNGRSSATSGKILKRNLDMGQLIIDTDNGDAFDDTETIDYQEVDGSLITMKLVNETAQYNAVHHYEDANGEYVDIDPHDDAQPSAYTPITNLNRLERRNDELKEIVVLKDSVIANVVGEFNKFMKG